MRQKINLYFGAVALLCSFSAIGQTRGHKADLFEGGRQIPCLMQWLAKIKTAHTESQTICLNDFMATKA